MCLYDERAKSEMCKALWDHRQMIMHMLSAYYIIIMSFLTHFQILYFSLLESQETYTTSQCAATRAHLSDNREAPHFWEMYSFVSSLLYPSSFTVSRDGQLLSSTVHPPTIFGQATIRGITGWPQVHSERGSAYWVPKEI